MQQSYPVKPRSKMGKPRLIPPFALVLGLILALSLSLGVGFWLVKRQMQPPSRQLRDLILFQTERLGQWAGSGDGMTLEVVSVADPSADKYQCNVPLYDNHLPIDELVTYNDLPSYRLHATGESGWWIALLAGNNWESYSLAPYHANGYLSFNIKGAAGNESFLIGLQDVVFERDPKHFEPTTLNLSDYVTVTTEWQRVEIPLKDLVPETALAQFDLSQISSLKFARAEGQAAEMTVWLHDLRWQSPDDEPTYNAIKINQLGYTPSAEKYALISGFSDLLPLSRSSTPFRILSATDNSTVYSGTLRRVTRVDRVASGERVWSADFSSLQQEGEYRLEVEGLPASPAFAIQTNLYTPLIIDSARYFFHQRQGTKLLARHAAGYERGIGHPQDSDLPFKSGQGSRDVSGGWYDAGDYGKYTNAGALAVTELLWAYELFPQQFSDNQFNIPESGNQLPDLLDEVRYELDWLMKMQEPSSGGFYHMVRSEGNEDASPDKLADVARFIQDQDMTDPVRNGVMPTSTSASAVAALAHAALVYRAFDADYAAQLQKSAEFGWAYLQNTPQEVDIMRCPPGTPYGDEDDRDNRLWAAAALYRLTQEAQYDLAFAEESELLQPIFSSKEDNGYGVGDTGLLAAMTYFHQPDGLVREEVAQQFKRWQAMMLKRNEKGVWRTTLLDEDYYWGSNNVVLTTPLALIVGARGLGEGSEEIGRTSTTALNYLLGINPIAFSYISGYGENALHRPFSLIYHQDGKPSVPKGIIVGGPNAYNNTLLASRFPAKRYQDNFAAWSTNEHTIYWNSTLLFHAAYQAEQAR